ncbi:MAG: nuclear transport factor 2 family protein [Novosphingobium sp.]|nr:nuclear transport factor 2 family protein [Novosphingobium sp.]
MRDSERIVRSFFDAVSAGELPDDMVTPDMKAWTTTGGHMDKAAYQQVIRLLGQMSKVPLTFVIDSVTAQDDRIAAELHSVGGVLINGEPYENTYVFVFRVRDGRIASVAEHFNALIVQEKMMPLVQQLRGVE